MNSMWLEMSCTVPEEAVEDFGDFLVELSGNGISIENLAVDTFSIDNIPSTPVKSIKAYFPADTSQDAVAAAVNEFICRYKKDFPRVEISQPVFQLLKEEDWANNWKEYFKPSRIGEHLVIKPTWEVYEAGPADVIIEVDPGQAFGTGTHATTRLCLEALEKILYQSPDCATGCPKAASVLDVGTGSGVLSIAAAKLGAHRITAVDIDPEAVEVAKENFVVNHIVGDITISTTPLRDIPGMYDIVVANIIAEELVRLAPELFARIAPKGHLILSGILTEREDYVRTGFSRLPLLHVEVLRREEWSCIVYRRES